MTIRHSTCLLILGVGTLLLLAVRGEVAFDFEQNGADWFTLDDIPNNQCGATLRSSPIDIRKDEVKKGASVVSFFYPPLEEEITIFWNDIFVDGELRDPDGTEDFGYLQYQGKQFVAVSFHFHSRSEHTFDGKQFPLEMHIVHVRTDNDQTLPEFAVLGFLFAEGPTRNRFLASLENPDGEPRLPSADEPDVMYTVDSDLSELGQFAADSRIFHYPGSLTTPPCTQAVNWFVVQKPLLAKKEQLDLWVNANLNGNSFRLTQNPEVIDGQTTQRNELVDRFGVLKINADFVPSLLPVEAGVVPDSPVFPDEMRDAVMMALYRAEKRRQHADAILQTAERERHDPLEKLKDLFISSIGGGNLAGLN
uniref:carbonic anhydrase n=1 Tax=Vitrella brassicaformis TaxID=1169539 RepID=A0A7S1JMN0_9ALVE